MIRLKRDKREHIAFVCFVAMALVWNMTVYWGTRIFTYSWSHHNIMSSWDRKIPLVPWTVLIYLGCYLFWGVNYWLCAAQEERERNRYYCADFLAKAVCAVVFLTYPTTNTRPELVVHDGWGFIMKLLYWVDSPDNLFPSIHCLVSWFCWIGVRSRKDIPGWYRYLSLVLALAVCVSTLTTRQHVLVDVFGGIFLAELCWQIARFDRLRDAYGRMVNGILNPIITWLDKKITFIH